MDAWDYLVAVVREALQGLGCGMAGAQQAYMASAASHAAVAPGIVAEGHGEGSSQEVFDYHWDRMMSPAYSHMPDNVHYSDVD